MNKKIGKIILYLCLSIVIISVILLQSLVITNPNEFAVIKQFGKIVDVKIGGKDSPSLKIPFIQVVQKVPQSLQIYDLAASDVITKDKKTMVADCFALWKITDTNKFISSLNASINSAEARINTIVYNSLKNVISSMNQDDIIANRDGELAEMILNNIGSSMDDYGIQITAVETKMLDLPDDNKEAVYERMISERNNIAAQYKAEGEYEAKKIRNQTDSSITILLSEAEAEAERLMAEGEAEYMKILSQAYNDASKAAFYEFVRSLDAAKSSIGKNGNILVLDKNSPIAKLFYR